LAPKPAENIPKQFQNTSETISNNFNQFQTIANNFKQLQTYINAGLQLRWMSQQMCLIGFQDTLVKRINHNANRHGLSPPKTAYRL
jgi:hypothetical protein